MLVDLRGLNRYKLLPNLLIKKTYLLSKLLTIRSLYWKHEYALTSSYDQNPEDAVRMGIKTSRTLPT